MGRGDLLTIKPFNLFIRYIHMYISYSGMFQTKTVKLFFKKTIQNK